MRTARKTYTTDDRDTGISEWSGKLLGFSLDLLCQFTSGSHDEGVGTEMSVFVRERRQIRDEAQHWYDECCSFTRAILGASKDVSFSEGYRYSFFLNWGRLFETSFKNAHEEFAAKIHVFEFGAFCRCHIFSLWARIFWWWPESGFP